MRLIRCLMLGASVALLVLACNDSGTQPGTVWLMSSQSECHQRIDVGVRGGQPSKDAFWYESRCDTLRVHHDERSANCCAKFAYEIDQQANSLTLIETDTSTVPCRCVDCLFDLTAQISGLSGGSYTIKVRDSKSDSLLDSTVVEITPCLPQ